MYRLDDAPTATLLREIQFRIDALRGCVMPAYHADELIAELAQRVGRDSAPQGLSRSRVASLYARLLAARSSVRGMMPEDHWTPSPESTPEPVEAHEGERDQLDDPGAKSAAVADLRSALEPLGRDYGVRGARAFVDWFDALDGFELSGRISLVEIEWDADDPAPEKALLWYRDGEGLERSVRLGTVRRWLGNASNASDESSHPKPLCNNAGSYRIPRGAP